jgi:hypothetical protein
MGISSEHPPNDYGAPLTFRKWTSSPHFQSMHSIRHSERLPTLSVRESQQYHNFGPNFLHTTASLQHRYRSAEVRFRPLLSAESNNRCHSQVTERWNRRFYALAGHRRRQVSTIRWKEPRKRLSATQPRMGTDSSKMDRRRGMPSSDAPRAEFTSQRPTSRSTNRSAGRPAPSSRAARSSSRPSLCQTASGLWMCPRASRTTTAAGDSGS